MKFTDAVLNIVTTGFGLSEIEKETYFRLRSNLFLYFFFLIFQGIDGPPGIKGEFGYPGPVGAPGLDGRSGLRGEKGTAAPREEPRGYVYAFHSQKRTIPECPPNSVKLWDGFSLASMVGSSRAAGQDLGSPGSCLQQFSAMPYMFCDLNNVCSYAQNNDDSLWLSTDEEMPTDMAPIERDDVKNYISRCSVCEFKTRLISIHAQDVDYARCPTGWSEVRPGYSYLMVSNIDIYMYICTTILTSLGI